MKLNRENYEEYFLLYLDGELAPAEMQAVEEFLAGNPDLAAEMDLLKETILKADEETPVVFTDIELLLKPEPTTSIHESNYESFLLSYIDGELSAEDRANVDSFVEKYLPAKEALALLGTAKLQPDLSVVFPNKEMLYRKEEKTRKLVYFRWQYAAVAAIMMGIFVTVWMNRSPSPTGGPAMAETEVPKKTAPVTEDTMQADTKNELAANIGSTQTPAAPVEKNGTVAKKKTELLEKVKVQHISDQGMAVQQVPNKKVLPEAQQVAEINPSFASNTITPSVTNITEKKGDLQLKPGEIKASSQTALSSSLAANENAQADEDVLLIGSARVNKTAFRGILRKTGRFLERTANVGENKTNQFFNGKTNNKKDQ